MALNYLAAMGLLPEQAPVGGPRALPQPVQPIDPNQPFENGLAPPEVAPAPNAAPQARTSGQRPRGGFVNTLGRIADLLALIGGSQPLYGPMRTQEQQRRKAEEGQAALAEWLANPDDPAAFRRALLADPDRAIDLREGLQGEAYTLGEGQRRFQGDKMIAEGPAGAPEVTVIDGIAYDRRTGEPLFESPYPRIIAGTDGEFLQQPRLGLGRRPTGGGQTPASGTVPPSAVEYLRQNPSLRGQFDQKYGPGAADRVLGVPDAGGALSAASQAQAITPEEAARIRQSLGPNGQAAFENWLGRNNIVIGGR